MAETRKLDELRSHPENASIFGDPEESPEFDAILKSIRAHGIWEPIVIKPDGTILSGHLRRAAAQKLKLKEVPVRVVEPFATYLDEVTFVIRSNTDRRQLTKAEIALAFKRLKELPKEQGGTKKKRGRKEGSVAGKVNSGASPTISDSRSRDEAAALLGVSTDEARALETVFTTPGVPEELKQAVNKGEVKPTPAAKAVKAEAKRQGGEIKNPEPLKAAAVPKAPKSQPAEPTHEDRVRLQAEAHQRDYKELHALYAKVDGILTRRPLKSVIGPTEHHEYRSLIRDLALRAWREIESIDGATNAGRQMAFTVIDGGSK